MYNNKISPQVQTALRYENILPFDGFRELTGFSIGEPIWTVLVTYFGDLSQIESELDAEITIIDENFAIMKIDKNQIDTLGTYTGIIYIEFPEVMEYILENTLDDICVSEGVLNQGTYNLSGEGILVGIVDSGIDYNHLDFITPEGKSRIYSIWDQSLPEVENAPYNLGQVFTNEQINEVLTLPLEERKLVIPTDDANGHGTALAGIVGGSGRASGGRNKGVAPGVEYIVVKLDNPLGEVNRGPRNIEGMLGIQYILNEAIALDRPVVILFGLGINEGSHEGNSTLELFINEAVAGLQANVVVGTGNQANKEAHTSGTLQQGEENDIQIYIAPNQSYYFLTLWKDFEDTFSIQVQSPAGETTEPLNGLVNNRAYIFGNTAVLINFSEPSQFNQKQQVIIFLENLGETPIDTGIWSLKITGEDIVQGGYNIWASSPDPVRRVTRFLDPDPFTTLTIPSTTLEVTSVAAFNPNTGQTANYSGRGYRADDKVKPDLSAPGSNIRAPQAGTVDGYTQVSGTSAAAAFVVGAYAILMEYGILKNNDPFLAGERLKAYAKKNARRDDRYAPFPNPFWGYGIICVEETLSSLRKRYNAGN